MLVTLLLFLLALTMGVSTDPVQIGALPDPQLTPGDALNLTAADICTVGYTKRVRNVPAAVKRRVYAAYRRIPQKEICCEIDHLIPLELGGSNRMRNLWPEPYDIDWNAHVKDRIEGRLHKLVCDGDLDLATAQSLIAQDWRAAYQQYRAQKSGTRAQKHYIPKRKTFHDLEP